MLRFQQMLCPPMILHEGSECSSLALNLALILVWFCHDSKKRKAFCKTENGVWGFHWSSLQERYNLPPQSDRNRGVYLNKYGGKSSINFWTSRFFPFQNVFEGRYDDWLSRNFNLNFSSHRASFRAFVFSCQLHTQRVKFKISCSIQSFFQVPRGTPITSQLCLETDDSPRTPSQFYLGTADDSAPPAQFAYRLFISS